MVIFKPSVILPKIVYIGTKPYLGIKKILEDKVQAQLTLKIKNKPQYANEIFGIFWQF